MVPAVCVGWVGPQVYDVFWGSTPLGHLQVLFSQKI
jgi:hypothetical protein